MAFTDVETAQAHQAAFADPTGEDLCKLGILYSTGQGGEIDYVGASSVELIGGGESAGNYREVEVKDGKYETVKFH